jgi:hypothetical protein
MNAKTYFGRAERGECRRSPGEYSIVTPDERSEIRGPLCRRQDGPRLARLTPLGVTTEGWV